MMQNKSYFILCFLSIFFFSCEDSEKNIKKEKKQGFEMYQPSELALLMEDIYVQNDSLRAQIIRGETPSRFSGEILKIHTAEMTNTFSRDASFKKYAAIFIENQNAIYTSTAQTVKANFNATINTCVACHQTSCTGPIPRIKKLLIN